MFGQLSNLLAVVLLLYTFFFKKIKFGSKPWSCRKIFFFLVCGTLKSCSTIHYEVLAAEGWRQMHLLVAPSPRSRMVSLTMYRTVSLVKCHSRTTPVE